MVSALETLEAEGRVLVVFDDRGKVMVVSEAEAEAVARVVEKEGRISLAKLTAMCDSMIDLKGEWCVCCQAFSVKSIHLCLLSFQQTQLFAMSMKSFLLALFMIAYAVCDFNYEFG